MTTADALVSVVVPIFNGERFIGRTLESALAQTYDAIEVIAVDDGSTDRTPIIVKTIAAKDPRVRYFRTDNFRRLPPPEISGSLKPAAT